MIYPGLKIGDYEIVDELGRGGFGSVFLAKDVNSGKGVAIKFLHPKSLKSKNVKQNFVDEMINQARLSSNINIVRVERSLSYKDNQGEHMGMVMEFVEGEPLDLYIEKHGLLPDFVAIPIFLQVLNGLSFAHQLNMLHRDIKPGNIMIGNNGIVKIMDFGLAKMVQGSSAASESARAASLSYVAPERIEKKLIDQRTDIYSLGATFYEALTGVTPYQIEPGDWKDAEHKHNSGNFKSIKDFYPQHSENLDSFIKRSLATNRNERFQNCWEMVTELRKIWKEKQVLPPLKEEFKKIIEKTDEIRLPDQVKKDVQTDYKPQVARPEPKQKIEPIVEDKISIKKIQKKPRIKQKPKVISQLSEPNRSKQKRIIASAASIAILIISIILISSYFKSKAEDEAWQVAKRINNISSYEEYQRKYSNGKYILYARSMIHEIEYAERKRKEERREAQKKAEENARRRKYSEYVSKTRQYFKNGEYDQALFYIQIAEKVMINSETESLRRSIISKKKEIQVNKSYPGGQPESVYIDKQSIWIFTCSDKRYLTHYDLKDLTPEELWKARNEIFAKHGYIFKTKKGKQYAQSLSGNYKGRISDASEIFNSFNRFEKYNVNKIKEYEK